MVVVFVAVVLAAAAHQPKATSKFIDLGVLVEVESLLARSPYLHQGWRAAAVG